jgi:hypothetical protein
VLAGLDGGQLAHVGGSGRGEDDLQEGKAELWVVAVLF